MKRESRRQRNRRVIQAFNNPRGSLCRGEGFLIKDIFKNFVLCIQKVLRV